jgi:chorismate mutase
MICRGVRGATTVEANDRELVLVETRRLLALMIRVNDIHSEDVASIFFSTTRDLNAEFPALAARQLGWIDVPLMCTNEIDVPHGLPLCVRILLHWNTHKSAAEIQHVYLKDAKKLRPDIESLPSANMEELERWIAEQMRNVAK